MLRKQLHIDIKRFSSMGYSHCGACVSRNWVFKSKRICSPADKAGLFICPGLHRHNLIRFCGK